jgi:hypothetical protein
MSECPRMVSRDDLIAGLLAGKTAVVDRKDAPELQDLLALEREGLVTSKLVQRDEQSSVMEFRWTRAETAHAFTLVQRIRPILAGNSPEDVSAALAELVSLWLVGHPPELRAVLRKEWTSLLDGLIKVNAEEFDPLHEAARNEHSNRH